LGGHHTRHRRHAFVTLRRAQTHGQHARQWPGQAICRRARHLHDVLRCGYQRPQSHQPAGASECRASDDRDDPRSEARSRESDAQEKPLITATMFGVTTPCVEAARKIVEAQGYEVLVFHATGTGGLTMESFIQDGLITGVLDITTTELADELVGGILTAGKDRLTAAGLRGVPQIISLGALDMVNFGPPDT